MNTQVLLLVNVGIPSISAPPTDWSPNGAVWKHHLLNVMKHNRPTSLWRISANCLRTSVGSSRACDNTSTLLHGTQHTQHLNELSLCFPANIQFTPIGTWDGQQSPHTINPSAGARLLHQILSLACLLPMWRPGSHSKCTTVPSPLWHLFTCLPDPQALLSL